MTRRTIPSQFVLNSLPKALCARLTPIATLCLCDPMKPRNPRCPTCKSSQTQWRPRMHSARCEKCGTVF